MSLAVVTGVDPALLPMLNPEDRTEEALTTLRYKILPKEEDIVVVDIGTVSSC